MSKTKQLHRIEGKVPTDVSLGYGLLGTIHAGKQLQHGARGWSRVASGRMRWSIRRFEGKAMLFKEIGRNEHVVHSEFKRMSDNISVTEAVALLVR